MTERQGWWKHHRKMEDSPLVNQSPAYYRVWCWMLSEAQFTSTKSVIFKGKQIYLKPGQFTCGAIQIAKATKVPRGTVERIIKKFTESKMIEVQTSNKCSLITVLNWSNYQNDEEQAKNNKGSNKKQMRTTEEVKNDKNEKEETPNTYITLESLTNNVMNMIKQGWKLYYNNDPVYVDDSGKISVKCFDGRWLEYSDSLNKLKWVKKSS